MSCLLGIDLGTSSVKVVVFDPEGALKGVGMSEYPILTPRLGYAEQDPEQWWLSTKTAVREALENASRPDILGIGFSGQMHGLVLLDKKKNLLRPALIWADQRSADVLTELYKRIDSSLLAPAVEYKELSSDEHAEASHAIRERVLEARNLQHARFAGKPKCRANAQMSHGLLKAHCKLDSEGREFRAAPWKNFI